MSRSDWLVILAFTVTTIGVVIALNAPLLDSEKVWITALLLVLGFLFIVVFLWRRILLPRWLRMLIHLRYRDGRLVYRKVHNVMVRVQTIQTILDSVASDGNSSDREDRLRALGRTVGSTFSADFIASRLFPNGILEGDLETSLPLWAEYDRDAGFASFDFEYFVYKESISGHVYARNSFLAWGRREDQTILCYFMEGYVSGVLSALLAKQVNVTTSCPIGAGPQHTQCKFDVSLP